MCLVTAQHIPPNSPPIPKLFSAFRSLEPIPFRRDPPRLGAAHTETDAHPRPNLAVVIVAALMILGVAASGLILAQKGSTPTATAASTVYIASVTQEVSALPPRAPVSQIAQATGSEASPIILQANVDAQSGSPMTTVTQTPSAAPVAPNVKDQSPSTISKAMVHERASILPDPSRHKTGLLYFFPSARFQHPQTAMTGRGILQAV
jgi:hypothetical protein